MVDPFRPVGPQPIGPLRPEGTGAKGPQAPPDLFQKTLDEALQRLGKPDAAQETQAARAGSAVASTQALLGQLERMQADLSARVAQFLTSPNAEGAVQLSNAADTAYDVHQDVRDRLVGLMQTNGMVA